MRCQVDALKVFYRIRHEQDSFDALISELRFVFATYCHFQAMAAVHSQCGYVMRHRGQRPAGREETGAMLGAVTTMAEALALCESHKPDILITCDQLEDADGLELVGEAHRRWPELKILLVLQHTTLPRLKQALSTGCNGILTDALLAEGYILTALRTVLSGDTYLDPSLDALLESGKAGWDPQLSARQLLIMAKVLEGLGDRDIAAQLDVPFDTVRHQLKLVYRALGTNNRCHACLILLQLGLLRMPLLPSLPAPPTERSRQLRHLRSQFGPAHPDE